MNEKIIAAIQKEIYRQFPDFSGILPKVRRQPVEKSGNRPPLPPEKRDFLFTFSRQVKGPGGQTIPRWVRVVVSPQGKIVKITTSK